MPIPSLHLQNEACVMQRSRGFGHGVVVSKICYNAVIVLSVVLCDCCKPMNSCWDWAFSNSGLEAWLQPFSCRCSLNVAHCRKRFMRHVYLRNPCLLWNLSYQKLEVPERGSTLHQLCIIASCPSLWCSWSKNPVSCTEAKGVVTELLSPRFVT